MLYMKRGVNRREGDKLAEGAVSVAKVPRPANRSTGVLDKKVVKGLP